MKESAYFDNAATTYPKPEEVYSQADLAYRTMGGNAGRGSNPLSNKASGLIQSAKEQLKELYACYSKGVAFTSTATEALNRIILGSNLAKGDFVYVTPFEHNAVTRPLHFLTKENGIVIEKLRYDRETFCPDLEGIKEQFQKNAPRLVVLTHASNVCGAVIPVIDICKVAKEYGATTVVDMSQTAGLLHLELASDLIDFAVFAGHKTLFGPFGIGGFFFEKGSFLKPILFGGNGINSLEQDMPSEIIEMTEIGSRNTYAIAGLNAAVKWISELGLEKLSEIESNNSEELLTLLHKFPNIQVIGESMECERIGVISTVFKSFSPSEIEQILGSRNISVRAGLHCSPYAHEFLGTLPAGTVRFSVSALTDKEEFKLLERTLEEISEADK